MPGALDGFGLAEWVRSNLPEVSIILTSGDAMKAKMARTLCKEESVVQKPYRLEAIAAKIRAALNISIQGEEPNSG